MAKMTKVEFEKRYAKRSKLTVQKLHDLGVSFGPCDCGDEICQGWQAITRADKIREEILSNG